MIVEYFQSQFILFTLILSRVSAMVMTAPLYSTTALPVRIRALFAVAIALLLTPFFYGPRIDVGQSVISYASFVGSEVLVGLLLGLGITMLISGIQIAGQLISQLSGMSLADVFSPGLDAQVPLFSQLLFYVTLAVFLLVDGHRLVMSALLDTFVAMPPGEASLAGDYVGALTTIVTQSFVLGIRAAAPAMGALLMSTLVLGLITRTLPQINIIAVGFGANAMLTIAGLFVTIGAIAWTFQEQTEAILGLLLNSMKG